MAGRTRPVLRTSSSRKGFALTWQHDGAVERIDSAVFALVPEFARASLRLVAVGPGHPESVRAFLKAVGERASAAARAADPADPDGPDGMGDHGEGAKRIAWRAVYSRVGLHPDTLPPPDALLGWAASPDGVPSTCPVSDLVNAFSLVHGVPTAAYDLSGAQGGLWLRPARGHEVWEDPAGHDDGSPPINELILADGSDRVVARNWHGSPGRPFVVGPTSTAVQVHVDVVTPINPELRAAHLAMELGRLATAYLGCTVASLVLSRGTPSVRWSSPLG